MGHTDDRCVFKVTGSLWERWVWVSASTNNSSSFFTPDTETYLRWSDPNRSARDTANCQQIWRIQDVNMQNATLVQSGQWTQYLNLRYKVITHFKVPIKWNDLAQAVPWLCPHWHLPVNSSRTTTERWAEDGGQFGHELSCRVWLLVLQGWVSKENCFLANSS